MDLGKTISISPLSTREKREVEEMRGTRVVKSRKDEALRKLRELSEMFDLEESAVVRSHSRSSSMDRGSIGSGAASAGGSDRPKQARQQRGKSDIAARAHRACCHVGPSYGATLRRAFGI